MRKNINKLLAAHVIFIAIFSLPSFADNVVVPTTAKVDRPAEINSSLQAALDKGDFAAAELLLKQGANINDQNNKFKQSPLFLAVANKKTPVVKWIIEHGANSNLQDAQGYTATSLSGKGHVEILKVLFDHGVKPQFQDISKITKDACQVGNIGVLKYLISKEISPDYDACYTALVYLRPPNNELLKWLSNQSKIKNVKIGNDSLLHSAVAMNNLEIAKLLIESGADVNTGGVSGRPPLSAVIVQQGQSPAKNKYKEMITLFSTHGADFNIKYGYRKDTLLHQLTLVPDAEKSDRFEEYCQMQADLAELLIASGADVNSRDEDGNTPLHTAAIHDNLPMLKLLASHDADLKSTNTRGQTPLYYAIAVQGWEEMKHALLTIGTLISLEERAVIPVNWTKLKDAANRAHYPKQKEQILTLLNQLEKDPSIWTQDNNLIRTVDKIVDDAYKALQANSGLSNDPTIIAAATKAHAGLKGVWIIDPEATKELLKSKKLTSKEVDAFGMMAPFMLGLIYEFDSEAIRVGVQNSPKKLAYHIFPNRDGEMKYLSENNQRPMVETLTVSIVNNENIKISSTQNPTLDFLVWKRADVNLGPISKANIAGHSMEFWWEWMQEIGANFKNGEKSTDRPEQNSGIYKWRDASGKIQYSDHKPDDGSSTTVKIAPESAVDTSQQTATQKKEGSKFDGFVMPFDEAKIPFRFILTSEINVDEPVNDLASIKIDLKQKALHAFIKLIGVNSNTTYNFRIRIIDAKGSLIFDAVKMLTTSTNSIWFDSRVSPNVNIDAPGTWTFQGIVNDQKLFVEKREVVF